MAKKRTTSDAVPAPSRAGDPWTAFVDVYDSLTAGFRDDWSFFEQLLKGEGAPSVVLELMCGTGRCTGKIARVFPEATIIAVDSSPAMLERLRDHFVQPGTGLFGQAGRVKSILGDVLKLVDLVSNYMGRVDLCVATYSDIQLLKPAQRLQLYEGLHEALRPGGRFLFDDYTRTHAALCDASGKAFLWPQDWGAGLESSADQRPATVAFVTDVYFPMESPVRQRRIVAVDIAGDRHAGTVRRRQIELDYYPVSAADTYKDLTRTGFSEIVFWRDYSPESRKDPAPICDGSGVFSARKDASGGEPVRVGLRGRQIS